jgi:uncharacterized protein with FMN-binding domain
MKRFAAAVSLTIAGLAFVLGFKTRDMTPPVAADTTEPAADTGGAADAPSPAETSGTAGPTAQAPTTTAQTDGVTTTPDTSTTTEASTAPTGPVELEGPAVSTPYGPVQIAVMVDDGRLTDIIALELPGGDPRSDSINAYAAPILEEMALDAQSAEIDVVSGATFTSLAYTQSLQAALDQAGM